MPSGGRPKLGRGAKFGGVKGQIPMHIGGISNELEQRGTFCPFTHSHVQAACASLLSIMKNAITK